MRKITHLNFGGLLFVLFVLVACKSSEEGSITFTGSGVDLNWIQATDSTAFPARKSTAVVSYDMKMWVIGGFDNSSSLKDVWYSSDGVNWIDATTDAAFGQRVEHQVVNFNGEMLLIGGVDGSGDTKNDIWHSSDGGNWFEATSDAGFPPRRGHKVLNYNNKLWLIAGVDGSGDSLNDVWSSFDGINWVQETASAFSPARQYFGTFVYNNQMWVVSGVDAGFTVVYYDSWNSTDGANWTHGPDINPDIKGDIAILQGTPYSIAGRDIYGNFYNRQWVGKNMDDWKEINTAPFSPRYPHLLFHNDKLWAIGGEGPDKAVLNDVWSTQ